jgi:RTX calcium-binding nonapeptide repeat (4 copies)
VGLARFIVAAAIAFALLAAPASASTARVVDVTLPPACKVPPPSGVCEPRSETALVYHASPGEANRVSIAAESPQIRIRDQGAAIQPDGRCVAVDSNTVSCPPVGLILVDTGDGPDRFTSDFGGVLVNGGVIVSGGSGDDEIAGGPLADDLYGGRGKDVLRGRGGEDRLYDAFPRDRLGSGDLSVFFPVPFAESRFDPAGVPLADPGRGEDSFDGGPGGDTISYDGRAAGIRVDLAGSRARGAARGERDSVRQLENAIGGAGDDRLLGDRRANTLDGGLGDDLLVGRRGDDQLLGSGGRDAVLGGPGDDFVSALPGPSAAGSERLICGVGTDRVGRISPSYFVEDDCEVLAVEFLSGTKLFGDAISLLPLARRGPPTVMTTMFECPRFPDDEGCRLRLELRLHPGGRLLGLETARYARGDKRDVSLGLSRAGMRLLRRRGSLLVRVILRENAPHEPLGYMTELRVSPRASR